MKSVICFIVSLLILSDQAWAQRAGRGGHGGGNGTFYYNGIFKMGCARAYAAMKKYPKLKVLDPDKNEKSLELYRPPRIRKWRQMLQLAAFAEDTVVPKDHDVKDKKGQSRAAVAFPELGEIHLNIPFMRENSYKEDSAFVDCVEEAGHLAKFENHENLDAVMNHVGLTLLHMSQADSEFETFYQATIAQIVDSLGVIRPIIVREITRLAVFGDVLEQLTDIELTEVERDNVDLGISLEKLRVSSHRHWAIGMAVVLYGSAGVVNVKSFGNILGLDAKGRRWVTNFSLGMGTVFLVSYMTSHCGSLVIRDFIPKALSQENLEALRVNRSWDSVRSRLRIIIDPIATEMTEVLLLSPRETARLKEKLQEQIRSRGKALGITPGEALIEIDLISALEGIETYDGSYLTNEKVYAYKKFKGYLEKMSEDEELMRQTATTRPLPIQVEGVLERLRTRVSILETAQKDLGPDSILRRELGKALEKSQAALRRADLSLENLKGR